LKASHHVLFDDSLLDDYLGEDGEGYIPAAYGSIKTDTTEALDREYMRSNCCGNTMVAYADEAKTQVYLKTVHCAKFWCADCGGFHGFNHMSRIGKIKERILPYEMIFLRQFVFTIPVEHRFNFQSREMLNKYFQLVRRLIYSYFGKAVQAVFYIHLFGDKDQVFHPHMNVHIVERDIEGVRYKLDLEVIENIKKSYIKALSSLLKLKTYMPVIDVQYSFRVGGRAINHAITYMSRPLDIDRVLVFPVEIQNFLVLELKGFQYIRYSKALTKQLASDFILDVLGDKKESDYNYVSPVDGKKLSVVGVVGRRHFEVLTEFEQVLDLGNGVYQIAIPAIQAFLNGEFDQMENLPRGIFK
jgi:hypothetical protein